MNRAVVLFLWLAAPAAARQEPPEVAKVDFVRDIQPIFKAHCIGCHGAGKQKGQFRLDSRALAFRGGVVGKDIVRGRSKESHLIELLLEGDAENRMPKDAPPLPPSQIDLIRRWIDEGAEWPDAAAGDPGKAGRHWAYEKPVRHDPPAATGARTPVDAFIAAEHEARGLRPRPEAPKPLLLRRLYLDLTGLPPTAEELAEFLGDAAPDAYEKVVDRLLEDPRYGERWARHWMDVWRYSDWTAQEDDGVRHSHLHIWRWRDWIVESLNADKGYDRMILEMLAGDEVAPEDPRVLPATGFLGRNYYRLNRNTWLDAIVEHTSKAFLGATLNCARCHNHMYDPITQVDYYRFRAFFEPHRVRMDPLPGAALVDAGRTEGKENKVLLEQDGLVRVYDRELEAPTYLFERGDERLPDKSKPIPPGVPEAFGGIPIRIEPVKLPLYATAPHRRTYAVQDALASAEKAVAEARKGVDAAFRELVQAEAKAAAGGKSAEEEARLRHAVQETREKLPVATMEAAIAEAKRATLRACLVAEELEDAGQKGSDPWKRAALEAQGAQRKEAVLEAEKKAFQQRRVVLKARSAAGKATPTAEEKKLAEAEQALAKAEEEAKKPGSPAYKSRGEKFPQTSSGRRLALARWLASDRNPLTARVAVNHMWARHFGRPLVPTLFEFGAKSKPPSHPRVLDWLATEFVREGWSMKKIHRLLLTTSAYRRASTDDPEARAVDPENRYLWRMNPRRMDAEVVRDSVLYLAGTLDLTRGGRDLDHRQGLVNPRRSIYFQHAPDRQMEFLTLFDAANAQECYERAVSVVPQQALSLSNSSLVRDQSRLLARKLSEEVGKTTDPQAGRRFVTAAFRRVLGRSPSEEETLECEGFLSDQTQRLSDPEKLTRRSGEDSSRVRPADRPDLRARESLVLVLMNHNDFVTIR